MGRGEGEAVRLGLWRAERAFVTALVLFSVWLWTCWFDLPRAIFSNDACWCVLLVLVPVIPVCYSRISESIALDIVSLLGQSSM